MIKTKNLCILGSSGFKFGMEPVGAKAPSSPSPPFLIIRESWTLTYQTRSVPGLHSVLCGKHPGVMSPPGTDRRGSHLVSVQPLECHTPQPLNSKPELPPLEKLLQKT
jgi:hypothetical protein